MKTRHLVLGAMFIALGLMLPQLFHFLGPQAGTIFSPMHIPVLLAGLILGGPIGLVVGVLTPLMSHLVTGMPPISPVPMMVLMMVELGVYGLITGWVNKLTRSPMVALVSAMVLGRIALGLAAWGVAPIFGFRPNPVTFVWGGLVTGWPALVLQIVLIPLVMAALKPVLRQREYPTFRR